MRRGFTLIELLVVLAIVALLASLAAPRYLRSLEVAEERALRTSLRTMRDAIDQYTADRGRAPASLEALVAERYLREIPEDPLTRRRDSWVELQRSDADGGLGDVRSGAAGRDRDGALYADW